jgi:CDP-glucose 4,6-dehydratase
MQSVIGDVRDLEHLKQTVQNAKPDIVFHMAAQPIVREGYADPVGTYETNVMGTVNLLESCRAVDTIRSIVNVTTDKVYENREWVWGYRENENLCGADPYSNSKSCSELVTYSYRYSFYANADAPAVSSARAGNVIGGGDFAKDRIMPDCVRATLNSDTIVMRNPHSIRPYQHVLECLSGYLLLAEKQYSEKDIAGCYNFGPRNEDCVTTRTLVELFCEKWGEGAKFEAKGDGGPPEANVLKLDIAKARQFLGWEPVWDIETAVEKVVEWHKFDAAKDAVFVTDKQIKGYFD